MKSSTSHRGNMNGRIIDGRAVASDVEKGLRPRIDALTQEGRAPHLAVVIVGADPASQVYVGAKVRACERLGITSTRIDLDANTTMEALESMVMDLNADPTIDGILVQSPLPEGQTQATFGGVAGVSVLRTNREPEPSLPAVELPYDPGRHVEIGPPTTNEDAIFVPAIDADPADYATPSGRVVSAEDGNEE